MEKTEAGLCIREIVTKIIMLLIQYYSLTTVSDAMETCFIITHLEFI